MTLTLIAFVVCIVLFVTPLPEYVWEEIISPRRERRRIRKYKEAHRSAQASPND